MPALKPLTGGQPPCGAKVDFYGNLPTFRTCRQGRAHRQACPLTPAAGRKMPPVRNARYQGYAGRRQPSCRVSASPGRSCCGYVGRRLRVWSDAQNGRRGRAGTARGRRRSVGTVLPQAVPGFRLFGRFIERDAFVGLRLCDRRDLRTRALYEAAAQAMIEEWARIFGNIPPLRSTDLDAT